MGVYKHDFEKIMKKHDKKMNHVIEEKVKKETEKTSKSWIDYLLHLIPHFSILIKQPYICYKENMEENIEGNMGKNIEENEEIVE
jgi:hypothetical protein